MRQQIYKLFLCFFLSSFSTDQLSAQNATARHNEPNVVVVLVDDLGYKDLGCYGSNFYKTPNIDRLAGEGMKFVNAYASCNVCSPSRASLLTGKSPARLHITDWIRGYNLPFAKLKPPQWTQFLPLEETTIAEVLKTSNYATASIGKWHLGDDVKYYPENQGFDINIAGNFLGSPRSYFSPYRLPRLEDGPAGEYLTERLTSDALDFIKMKKDSSFFLYLSYYAVHTPLQGKEDDVELYKSIANPDSGQRNPVYAAVIKSVDDNVGRLTSLIDSLGLADNTIIIFTSDNGGLIGRRNHITSNAPLREGKGTAYEGGVKIPFIVKWKDKIMANSVSDERVIHSDLFPTIAALTKAKVNLKDTDGQNLSALLLKGGSLKRDALYWHYPHYHSEGATPHTALLQGDWKLIYYYETGTSELYNLRKDPEEKNNLAVKESKIALSLLAKVKDWKKKVGAQDPVINPAYDPLRAAETKGTERSVSDN